MAATPQRLDRTPGVAAPSVEVRAPEEELAPDPRLLGRDGTLGSEPAQAVAADAEVLGGAAAVHPLICPLALRLGQPSCYAVGDELGELAKELVQDETAGSGLGERRIATDESELRRGPSLLGGVGLHCRDLPKVSAGPRGVPAPPGPLISVTPSDYTALRTELLTGDGFAR